MKKRKNYSHKKIKEYWADKEIWDNKFDSKEEFLEADCCFACGVDYSVEVEGKSFKNLERAHIKALIINGEDKIQNIHLLCKTCHSESEILYDELYWFWFNNKTWYGASLSLVIRIGGAEFFQNLCECTATEKTIALLR